MQFFDFRNDSEHQDSLDRERTILILIFVGGDLWSRNALLQIGVGGLIDDCFVRRRLFSFASGSLFYGFTRKQLHGTRSHL